MKDFGDVHTKLHGHVALVEMQRPPYNYFDRELIGSLADAFEYLDRLDECRALVLAAQGKAFSAGANFQEASGTGLFATDPDRSAEGLYAHALRLFATRKPIVAAIQGPAVGGGLGLSLVADFRVVCENSRFAANFVKLGVHAGFGISHVLPRIIGLQKASLLLYTGRRIDGREAMEIGLADVFCPADELRDTAMGLAAEIAEAAPLAVESTRETLRQGLVEGVREQLQREFSEQMRLAETDDHGEGVLAVTERRAGRFQRR
jgi:enoyl-CoA hydratase/carnithine racemase